MKLKNEFMSDTIKLLYNNLLFAGFDTEVGFLDNPPKDCIILSLEKVDSNSRTIIVTDAADSIKFSNKKRVLSIHLYGEVFSYINDSVYQGSFNLVFNSESSKRQLLLSFDVKKAKISTKKGFCDISIEY